MARRKAIDKLLNAVADIGNAVDIERSLAKDRHRRFAVTSFVQTELKKVYPTIMLQLGLNPSSPGVPCIVYDELRNGVYIMRVKHGTMSDAFVVGRPVDGHWTHVLWANCRKREVRLLQLLPHAEGGLYVHNSETVHEHSILSQLKRFESHERSLKLHKVFTRALAA